MFPKIKDWDAFKQRVELICQLIKSSIEGGTANEHLLSIDEKTGIQALERKATSPMTKGKLRRIEYEYERHGTTCVMGALNVSNGKLEHCRIHQTRKEKDFVLFMEQISVAVPHTDRITILADQLNIHKSATLVRWVAEKIGYQGNLGTKAYKGILRNQKTRMEFLENPDHRIRFVFTPKHCSWLNPIENWFGRLQRQRLKNDSFSSIEELENKLKEYIEFANLWLAKPYKWKFMGFVKKHKLSMHLIGS